MKMKMKKSISAIGVSLALTFSGSAMANILLSGNFVQTQISDDGTLGEGGNDPGLVYDSTGTGTFDSNFDYVAPGTPFEAFGIQYDGSSVLNNDNSHNNGSVGSNEDFNLTSLVDISTASVYDNHAVWTGGNSDLSITHEFFFNDEDERINISTIITALTDITGLLFSRAVDPDPDSRSHGTANTNNQRGIDNNADGDAVDPGDVAVENFVGSLGSVSGSPLGLFADTNFTQNTGIVSFCCGTIDPSIYLAGGELGDSSTGDHGIGIAFMLGDLLTGDSVSVNYAYVMGGSLDTIDLPPDTTPPVVDATAPSTIGLMLLSLGGLLVFRRK
jgi:hypothetical protein